MTTGDMYDQFFGDSFWEREYKPHIVAFADKCIAVYKSAESVPASTNNLDCDKCIHDGECYATVLKCKGFMESYKEATSG